MLIYNASWLCPLPRPPPLCLDHLPPPNRCLVSLILTSSSPTPPIRATHVRMALPVTTSSKKKDFSAGSHSLIALRRALWHVMADAWLTHRHNVRCGGWISECIEVKEWHPTGYTPNREQVDWGRQETALFKGFCLRLPRSMWTYSSGYIV